MDEKERLKKSGYWTVFILVFFSLFWFLFSIQPCKAGYTGGPQSGVDVGINSRSTAQANWQVGSSGVYVIRLGIENVTGLGTATGYMTGTNTYYPRIEWTPALGTFNFIGTGSYPVTLQMNGVAIPSLGSVSGKIDAVGGTGTNNVLSNPTFDGTGTLSTTLNASGANISPLEVSFLDGMSENINNRFITVSGSITNHAHTESDGTTQIDHDDVLGTGANSHVIIDSFINSKASALGLASLDGNSLVVQNPASATSTPSVGKIPISLGTGFLDDSWLSTVITKLGQDIQLGSETTGNTDNISEGITNKYHTDARVNAAVGSLTVNTLSDVNINMNAENDFVKIVGNQLVAGSSSTSVAFSEVTGSVTSNSNFQANIAESGKVLVGLSDVIKLPATTTSQVAQSYAQLYNYSTTGLFNGTVTITGGTATASSTTTGSAANVFDASTATFWESNPGLPQWVQYQFPEALNMNAIRCYNYANELSGTYTVSASNNGSDFYTIGTFTHGTTTDNTGVSNRFGTTTNYSYWRVTAPLGAGESSTMGIRDIEFGGLTTYPAYNVTIVPNDSAVALFTIQAPGSTSTQASYIYNNVTTTFWGLGTNTSVSGTTSGAYAGWSDRAIRVTAVDIASTEKIKENIKPIRIKPDLLDAEGMAKLNYIANNKIAWIVANGGSYTTIVNETGTGSVVVVDTDRIEADYNNYIELKWASDIDQDTYTENVQKTYEKGFWQMFDSVTPRSWNPKNNPNSLRKGFVVEEMPDVVWGEDKQSIDMGALIAYISLVQQALKADTIFALSTLKELITTGTVTQQKIDYCNDRLEVLNP